MLRDYLTFNQNRRPSEAELADFLGQMGILFDAGLPLNKILHLLEERFKNLSVNKLRTLVQEGNPLAEGFKSMGMDKALVNLISLGEETGCLGESLKRAAGLIDKNLKFKRKIINALAYPAFILLTSFICLFGFLVFILPAFGQMFGDFNVTLPLITRILMALPGFWPLGLLLGLLFAAMIYRIYKNEELKLKLPIFNRVYRDSQVAGFSRILGIQLKSSVPILEALITAAQSAGPIYKTAILKVKEAVENGESFNSALGPYPFLFPQVLRQMAAVGEESGNLDEMLLRMADYYEAEVENTIKRATLLIEPVSTLGVGLVVGVVALAMVMPLFSMVNALL